jgi:hypothetical protein
LQSRMDPPDVARSNCAAASGGVYCQPRLPRAAAEGVRPSRAKRASGRGALTIAT